MCIRKSIIGSLFFSVAHSLLTMATSRRSESMNAYFDVYVNSHTLISAFVEQFDKALADHRTAELEKILEQ